MHVYTRRLTDHHSNFIHNSLEEETVQMLLYWTTYKLTFTLTHKTTTQEQPTNTHTDGSQKHGVHEKPDAKPQRLCWSQRARETYLQRKKSESISSGWGLRRRAVGNFRGGELFCIFIVQQVVLYLHQTKLRSAPKTHTLTTQKAHLKHVAALWRKSPSTWNTMPAAQG